ncbi:MAG: hypothetical protein MUF49_19960 [Oculatellaceae cyanobacterium Prado106]|nr:hypothetical protein [Oculatellaceae cyanobacterium Prado106]
MPQAIASITRRLNRRLRQDFPETIRSRCGCYVRSADLWNLRSSKIAICLACLGVICLEQLILRILKVYLLNPIETA